MQLWSELVQGTCQLYFYVIVAVDELFKVETGDNKDIW